mmetsp:Transcript_9746/g.18312  ORF Transcript_9746/g.18312 Transcript_9746/m.18312 type:complete len:103 (-) Transcript_9746:1096-1404(-)
MLILQFMRSIAKIITARQVSFGQHLHLGLYSRTLWNTLEHCFCISRSLNKILIDRDGGAANITKNGERKTISTLPREKSRYKFQPRRVFNTKVPFNTTVLFL